jgi:hypothetical protein
VEPFDVSSAYQRSARFSHGRVQIEPDNVADVLDDLRILGPSDRAISVWFAVPCAAAGTLRERNANACAARARANSTVRFVHATDSLIVWPITNDQPGRGVGTTTRTCRSPSTRLRAREPRTAAMTAREDRWLASSPSPHWLPFPATPRRTAPSTALTDATASNGEH